MIRVRFHGRGGQGMKTASRIVGTAALLEGLVAQDSPVYGAERRGAPMVAYTRLRSAPILERGLIPVPDLVVLADDTLLDDPAARPLAGLPAGGVLFIATAHGPAEVRARTGHPGPVVARDLLAVALDAGTGAAGVSTLLAAGACRLVGLGAAATREAIARELGALGLPRADVDRAIRLAEQACAGLAPAALPVVASPGLAAEQVVDVAYVPAETGTASVTAPANTPRRRTGAWRVFRPVIDLARCTQCWICFVRCPEGAIDLDAADNPVIDYGVCKGCLICVEECPTHTIAREREPRAWDTAGAAP